MSYGDWFVAAGGALYVGASVSYALKGEWPFAMLFACYAVANAALIWGAQAS